VWALMVVATTDARPHGIGATAPSRRRYAERRERRDKGFRRRFRVAVHRVLDRHLITELRHFDVDLRNDGAGGDELAALGGLWREARSEPGNEIALSDELVGNGRGEAAADTK